MTVKTINKTVSDLYFLRFLITLVLVFGVSVESVSTGADCGVTAACVCERRCGALVSHVTQSLPLGPRRLFSSLCLDFFARFHVRVFSVQVGLTYVI